MHICCRAIVIGLLVATATTAMAESPEQIDQLLSKVEQGNIDAASQLLAVVVNTKVSESQSLRALAVAHKMPRHDAGFESLLAQIVTQLDTDSLGRNSDLETLLTQYPGSEFQQVAITSLRNSFPLSLQRIQWLSKIARDSKADTKSRRDAITGLSSTFERADAACDAIATALDKKQPALAEYATLRIAALPCGKIRDTALQELARRVATTAMTGDDKNLFGYLCPYQLEPDQQVAAIAVLQKIALSNAQPLAIRSHAMTSLRTCTAGDWKSVRRQLMKKPSQAMKKAVQDVDSIIIDR
jgi:hypothetical protein